MNDYLPLPAALKQRLIPYLAQRSVLVASLCEKDVKYVTASPAVSG
ncbi:hypothetical protein ACQK5W_10430 [Pantoea sp. FN060301]